jgi:hypothetical protein
VPINLRLGAEKAPKSSPKMAIFASPLSASKSKHIYNVQLVGLYFAGFSVKSGFYFSLRVPNPHSPPDPQCGPFWDENPKLSLRLAACDGGSGSRAHEPGMGEQ